MSRAPEGACFTAYTRGAISNSRCLAFFGVLAVKIFSLALFGVLAVKIFSLALFGVLAV